MNKQLRDYIKIYNGFYSKEFCVETIKQLETVEFEKHTFYNATSNTYHNVGNDFSTYTGRIPNGEQILKQTWDVIHKYITEDISFPWFTNWDGFTPPKFNKYDIGTNMKEHCDHIQSAFDGTRKGVPILTVLTSLNDDYDGGELVFFTDEVYTLRAGDVIVFPSNFLYPHRVNNITSGIRYSTVSWVW